jgi:hypothetical protein
MLGSVWPPIVFCLVMMAVCCGGPCWWDAGGVPAADLNRRTGDVPDGGRRWRQGAD